MGCVFSCEFSSCSTCWECNWTGGNDDYTQILISVQPPDLSVQLKLYTIQEPQSRFQGWEGDGQGLPEVQSSCANPWAKAETSGGRFLPRGLLATPRHCTRNSNQGCASCSSLLSSTGQLEGLRLETNEQQSENAALEPLINTAPKSWSTPWVQMPDTSGWTNNHKMSYWLFFWSTSTFLIPFQC